MPVLKPFSQQETHFTNPPPHPPNPKQHYMWEFVEVKKYNAWTQLSLHNVEAGHTTEKKMKAIFQRISIYSVTMSENENSTIKVLTTAKQLNHNTDQYVNQDLKK